MQFDNSRQSGICGLQPTSHRRFKRTSCYMKPFFHLAIVFSIFPALVSGMAGCSHTGTMTAERRQTAATPVQKDQNQRIEDLTQALLALDANVSEEEARGLAQSAIKHAAILGQRYRVVRPPHWHNLLVTFGWKKRGLCYHWTEDLLKHLEGVRLHHLHLQRVVAHRGSNVREHHSVLVITGNNTFEEGIVLDGWRGSGTLFWVPAGKDRYPWVPLSADNRLENAADRN